VGIGASRRKSIIKRLLIYSLGLRTDQVTGNLENKGKCDCDICVVTFNKDHRRTTITTAATAYSDNNSDKDDNNQGWALEKKVYGLETRPPFE
jgi:hypothetical protein